MYKKINYKNSLDVFKKIYFPSVNVNNSALELISSILNDVNSIFISYIENKYSSAVKISSKTFYHWARNAIDETLPEDLKANALSEAYKQLALLQSGCMEYPENRKGAKKKVLTKNVQSVLDRRILDMPFGKGIKKLLPQLVPDFKVHSQALGTLVSSIHAFNKIIASKILEKVGRKDELQPSDLQNVLAEYFGEKVLRVAAGEGNRVLTLYESGLIEFKPKKLLEFDWSDDPFSGLLPHHITSMSPVFKSGIKTLLSDVDPLAVSELKVQKYLEHIVIGLALFLAEKTSDKCLSENALEMNAEDLHQTVRDSFPKELKEHALLQSTKDVTEFQNEMNWYETESVEDEKGSIKSMPSSKTKKGTKRKTTKSKSRSSPKSRRTSPKTRRTSPKSKKRKKIKSPVSSAARPRKVVVKKIAKSKDLGSIMYSFVSNTFSSVNVSLAKNTSKDLTEFIVDVCDVLIEISVDRASSSEELDTKDIEAAVTELFPPDLASHALSAYSSKNSKR